MSNTAEQPNYYRVLGVSYRATPTEIKRAYRAAMKRSHPDRLAPEQRADAEARAREINEAFRILSRPESKQRYDAQLKMVIVQDDIMGRYADGLGTPGANQDLFARVNDARRAEQRKQQKQSDRQATTSILLIFAGFTLLVLALLVIGSIIVATMHRVG